MLMKFIKTNVSQTHAKMTELAPAMEFVRANLASRERSVTKSVSTYCLECIYCLRDIFEKKMASLDTTF